MKKQKDYTLHLIFGILLVAVLASSCASRCGQQRRYWSTHRAV